jgi:hypothetical protein
MSIRSGFGLTLLATVLLAASPAVANRHVVVNGERLTAEQAVRLDSIACTVVPNGYYWVAPNGAWGYAGNPMQMGVVGEQCPQAQAPPRKSLSERRLLFSTSDFLR